MSSANHQFVVILSSIVGGATVWYFLAHLFVGIWKAKYPNEDFSRRVDVPEGWPGFWALCSVMWPLTPIFLFCVLIWKIGAIIGRNGEGLGNWLIKTGQRLGARKANLPKAKTIRRG